MLRFDEVAEEVQEAAKTAVTEAAAAAADEARGTRMALPPHSAAGYYWYAFTDRIESEVTSIEARLDGSNIVAQFGATTKRGDYAFMLERLHPYLVPAYDKVAPTLAARIREILEDK